MEFFNKDSEIIKNISKSPSKNDYLSSDNLSDLNNSIKSDDFVNSQGSEDSKNSSDLNDSIVSDSNNENGDKVCMENSKDVINTNDDFEFTSGSSNKTLNSEIIDVRIIVTDLDYIESISKAVSNFDLNNFNVVISSIIPTTDVSIAKNNILNADLVLIATEFSDKGKQLFNSFYNELKNDINQVEYLKIPSGNFENIFSFEDEIANSIIRIGLSNVSNLSIINLAKSKYFDLKNSFNEEIKHNEELTKNIDELTLKNDNLNKINLELTNKIKTLQKDLDKIKSDFSDFKSKYVNIYSKDFLEIYSLANLWFESFSDKLTVDEEKFIEVATNNFKPDDILLGQGFIGAKSKESAIDWLKITRTAFVVVNTLPNSISNIGGKGDFDDLKLNTGENLFDSLDNGGSLEEIKDIFKELNDDNSEFQNEPNSEEINDINGLNILNTDDDQHDFYEINEDDDLNKYDPLNEVNENTFRNDNFDDNFDDDRVNGVDENKLFKNLDFDN